MICPHCSRSLLHKQRGRRRCSYCRKTFAFEPKANKLHLHDMKVRALDTKLSVSGELRYTVTQLWYAAARKQLTEPRKKPLSGCGCFLVVAGVLAFLAIGGANAMQGDALVGLAIAVGTVLVLAFMLLASARAKMKREAVIKPAIPLGEFRDMILRRWAEVHGSLPAGLVDELHATAPLVATPRIALVCPDRAVLACLGANGVPATFSMVLTLSPGNVPPTVPVIVLHDASPAGCRFAADVRAALPGRTVLDAGVRPRTVLMRPTMVRLRQKPVPAGQLAGFGLPAAEVTWLAQGWWSPVGAIPPRLLLAAVTRAVQRADVAVDPEQDRAERLGFLTWPAAS